MLGRNSSCNITLYPENYFYPYRWCDSGPIFKKNGTNGISKINETFSLHFYGKMSAENRVYIKDDSIFEIQAMQNCHLTYNLVNISKSFF